MLIPPREFERLVEEALDSLPSQFADLLENVSVVVEEEPSEDDRKLIHEGSELLGLYRGVMRTRRVHNMLPGLPDQISIFRGPIMRVTPTRAAAVQQIRDTVIHELGHYFGLHDHEMPY